MVCVTDDKQRKDIGLSVFNEFSSAEDVWFWCCRCRAGEAIKFLRTNDQPARVCETNDVYLILKKLQMNGILSIQHTKTLVKYGIKQIPPNHKHGDTLGDCELWRQSMESLEKELKKRRILL